MQLSDELRKASRIRLSPGQRVIIRTKDGVRVEEGTIASVDPATGTVRVETGKSGADLQIDVDVERYDLWVQSPPKMKLGRPVQSTTVYIRPGDKPNQSFTTGVGNSKMRY